MPEQTPNFGFGTVSNGEEPISPSFKDIESQNWNKLDGILMSGIALSQDALVLVNGDNNDVVLGDGTFQRIEGPTGAFAITGMIGTVINGLKILHNTSGQILTIANENNSSAEANRIQTLTGADVILAVPCSATLYYSIRDLRWILIGKNG